MNREETIKEISKVLKRFSDISVYLFGSSARGDYRTDSDIDILILLPDYITSKERVALESEICGALLPVELSTDIEISPIMLPNKVWNQRITPFTINVLKDRIAL